MTTPSHWDRVQGDAEDTLVCRLDGVQDLTGVASVVASVWIDGADVPAVTLDADTVDTVARTVRVKLSPWLADAAPDTWSLRIKATWSGDPAPSVSFPAGRPATIAVTAAPPAEEETP